MSTLTNASKIDLSVNITPPRRPFQIVLSPTAFLQTMSTQESLKRKMLLVETNDYDSDLKRVRLDPEPTVEDKSIGDYHVRSCALLPQDRQQLRVLIPFESPWKNMIDRLTVRIPLSLTYVSNYPDLAARRG
jgi:hypothetical protein